METVINIDRWLMNLRHKPLDPTECRSLRWRKAFELCLSESVQSPRIFSSLDFRLLLQEWFEKRCLGYRNDKVSVALHGDMFRCREGFGDMLSERKPCKGIDRNRRKFLCDDCHGIVERICRNVSLARNLSVVRKQSVRYSLANPFGKTAKVNWSKFTGKLKSIPLIFSHKLLCLLVLQQFSFKLTGQ